MIFKINYTNMNQFIDLTSSVIFSHKEWQISFKTISLYLQKQVDCKFSHFLNSIKSCQNLPVCFSFSFFRFVCTQHLKEKKSRVLTEEKAKPSNGVRRFRHKRSQIASIISHSVIIFLYVYCPQMHSTLIFMNSFTIQYKLP